MQMHILVCLYLELCFQVMASMLHLLLISVKLGTEGCFLLPLQPLLVQGRLHLDHTACSKLEQIWPACKVLSRLHNIACSLDPARLQKTVWQCKQMEHVRPMPSKLCACADMQTAKLDYSNCVNVCSAAHDYP